MTAIGALKTVHARDLEVPADISIAGFNDLVMAEYVEPSLTTVRQPKHEMGRLAADVLLKLMSGTLAEHEIKVSGELIVRESTGPPKRLQLKHGLR
jgi:DNA-binding LacI/PurR family transcriptional regulator